MDDCNHQFRGGDLGLSDGIQRNVNRDRAVYGSSIAANRSQKPTKNEPCHVDLLTNPVPVTAEFVSEALLALRVRVNYVQGSHI